MVSKSKNDKQKGSFNYVLLVIVGVLIFWGLITVATVSFPASLKVYGSPWNYLLNQLFRLGIGVVLAVICFLIPLKFFKKWALWIFLGNVLLLLLVFVPKIGFSSGGATRWLNLGGFLIQPSEFLKISFLLYLAAWFSRKSTNDKSKKIANSFLPFGLMLAVLFAILLKQPDMSTLGIICVSGLIIYFIADTPWWHSLIFIGFGSVAVLVSIKTASYRMARLLIFLNPWKDPLGMGYQLNQSLIAVGSGKLFGIGNGFSLGLSRQKLGFLPESMTDSIFAIIGEELGLIGGVALVLLFLAFLLCVLKISDNTGKDTFAKLLTIGIGVWICFQAFFNIGGMLGILPMGGVPLPFFSYGGSHILTELAAIGLLFNISKKYS